MFELATFWWQDNKHISHLFIKMELSPVLAELNLRRVSLDAHNLTSNKMQIPTFKTTFVILSQLSVFLLRSIILASSG